MTTRILFVCLGNICRSPAAENTLRHLAKQKNIQNLHIDSAGTAGYHIGKKPDSRMTATLTKLKIPVSGKARQFDKGDFEKFDLIIPMDAQNQKDIMKLTSSDSHRKKVTPFMNFSKSFTNLDVPDPYYGDLDGFKKVAAIIEDGCHGILESLKKS